MVVLDIETSSMKIDAPQVVIGTDARKRLKQFVEQLERMEEEKTVISDEIREKYAEIKSEGFDVKAVRAVLKLRKKDEQERENEEMTLDTYWLAVSGKTND